MKRALALLIFIAALAGGGYYYYANDYLPSQTAAEAREAPLQTTTVRRGDIIISAQGAGSLVPAAQVDLAFDSGGTLTALNVEVGDHVNAGDVIAQLDDTAAQNALAQAEFDLAQAQQSLAELTSPAAIAAAQLDLVTKQAAIAAAQKTLKNLNSVDVDYYADALADAQAVYNTAQHNATLVDVGTRSELASLEAAQTAADNAYSTWQSYIYWYGENHDRTTRAKTAYDNALEDLQVAQMTYDQAQTSQASNLADAQSALEDAQANYDAAIHYTPATADVALAQANLAVAQADVDQATATLAELQRQPLPEGAVSTLSSARNAVTQAELALTQAQQTLAATTLTSPITGTITAVNATAGAQVGTSAIVTVADLDNARVEFYIDETDLAYVEDGYPISVVFDAAPETTFTGTVLRVDPALVSVNNTSVVRAWATLDPGPDAVRLISGMNGTVEITAGEARNALIVPIEALRELGPDSYAVFIVGADGQLTFTPVTVGLKDVANAEITSGLNQGDVVSTGVVETVQ